jgi:hypothetical protein
MKFFISFLRQSFAVVALLVSASSTSAGIISSTITVNQTLDLNATQFIPGPGFQGWQGVPAFNGGFNVPIAVGDTFDFTIDFLGAQALTANDLSFVWAFSYAEAGSPALDVRGIGTFSFLDASGSAFLTSNVKNSLEGEVHFGQQFNSADFAGGLPSSLTFGVYVMWEPWSSMLIYQTVACNREIMTTLPFFWKQVPYLLFLNRIRWCYAVRSYS